MALALLTGRGDRRAGARSRGAAAIARRARSRCGEGARPLSLEVERVPPALGDRSVGARGAALVRERWAHTRDAVHRRGAGGAPADAASLFAVGAAEVQRVSLSIRARGVLSPAAVRGSRTAAAYGSTDTRQSVSRNAGALLPPDAGSQCTSCDQGDPRRCATGARRGDRRRRL